MQNIWVDPDGTRTGVPADWGAVGISYDSAVITEAPTSYDILFDPKYTGKVGMPDDPLGAYGQAAHVLGLNSSRMTEDDFKTVTNWLKDLAKQTKGVSPSYGDVSTRFIAGDIVALLPRLGRLQVVRRGGRQEHHRDGVAGERRRASPSPTPGPSRRAPTMSTRSTPGSTRR